MNASGVFVILMVVLLVFNFAYVSVSGDASGVLTNMAIGGVLGIVIPLVVVAILSGTNVVASGLNPASTQLIFGVGVLLGLLFQISFTIATFEITLGMGLLTNVFNVFASDVGYGVPFFVTAILGISLFVSGLLTFSGGGGGA